MSSLLHSCHITLFLVLAAVLRTVEAGYVTGGFRATAWQQAYATFYGDDTASETMGKFLFPPKGVIMFSSLYKPISPVGKV